MGQKGSSLKKGQRPKSPNEVCSKLNSSSSSYYSNYPELRNEALPEKSCLSISYKKKIPQWLQFFHTKCENLSPSQLSWAENGKILLEMESMRNFREEYDKLFQRKLKDTKQIISNRQSFNQKDQGQNLDNVLSDLNETAQPPSALQGLGPASKVNEENLPSVALKEEDDGDEYRAGSQRGSQLRQQQQNFGQRNTQGGQNTSFPSYMVENQYQGLRAGNITMMRLQDPETVKKNLLIYFECTSLISSHLEDSNFTLCQIRKLFLTCFYNRYSVALKNFRNSQKEMIQNQAKQEQNKGEFDQQSFHQTSQNQNSSFQNSLNTKSIDNDIGLNGSDCKLGINIRSKELASQEKFKPPREAMKIFKDALSEFEYFVKIFMETIKQYYDIHYLKDKTVNLALKELFSYKNFQNYVISKLFENDKIPKMLIEILKIVTPDDTPLIAFIQQQKISPYLFGVPPAFSLDSETKRALGINNSVVQEEAEGQGEGGKATMKQQIIEQQQFYEKHQQDEQAEENDEKDLDSEEEQDMVFDLQINQKKGPKMEAEFQQNEYLRTNSNASSISQENLLCIREPTLNINPYQRCIDCIRKIVNCPTPTGKFKQIILACEGIEKCIVEFYQKLGRTLKYTLNEDNIISILTYVIAQAQVPNLEAHCKFVNAFYKSPTKKVKLRYYLLAFEASVRSVHEIFSQGLIQDIGEINPQNDLNEDQPANVSLNTSARNLFQKNISKKLEETFGNTQNSKQIANITGKNSLLKQTLAEIKP